MADDLFSIRNNFYVGAYPSAIKDALSTVTESKELTLEKDCIVYRCYIAMGNYKMVLDNVSDADAADAKAVRLLARYFQSPQSKGAILEEMTNILSSSKTSIVSLMAATIFINEERYEDALRLLHSRATLEYMALNVQIFLSLFRTDLAQKEVAAMISINEDATLTQLSMARVNLALGGAKCQEAYFIYQEMVDKYSATVLLLNGLAVCQMLQHNYGEASLLLKQALEKNPNDPVTLFNMICCDQHSSKGTGSDHFSVYLKQLKSSGGQLLTTVDAIEQSFDNNASKFKF